MSPYKGPRNLQTSEPTRTSFRVTWDPAPGDVKGYRVIFHPVGEDIDLGELMVGPYDNTVVLEELRCVFRLIAVCHSQIHFEEYFDAYHVNNVKIICFWVYRASTKYTVNVFGMFEGGESMPLAGEERTTLNDGPDPPPFRTPSKVKSYSIKPYIYSYVHIM